MGVILIAEDAEPQGMIIALNTFNLWNPKVKELNELAYWVEPKYRGTTIGYRLLKSYIDYAELKKAQGDIRNYTISKMFNSPDLKYHKFGFNKLEEKWIK
jgi:RimJ/RimL family protein N-acetyltransferase